MQLPPDAFDRPNLSQDLTRTVRAMIVDGRLRPGERINEVHLAEALKVSRTPLREALSRLVAEEAVEAVPRRGYFVRPLTVDELEQLYDIRPILDPEALRLAGIPPASSLEKLTLLNRAMEGEQDPEKIIALDDVWHLELLRGCPNRVLVGMIEQVMLRTRRYELALMRDRANVGRAEQHHDRIVAFLHAGELEAACAELKSNMTHGKAPIIAWLKGRLAPGGAA